MEQITTVGIDLAKSVFSLHGVDARGVLPRCAQRVARSERRRSTNAVLGGTVTSVGSRDRGSAGIEPLWCGRELDHCRRVPGSGVWRLASV